MVGSESLVTAGTVAGNMGAGSSAGAIIGSAVTGQAPSAIAGGVTGTKLC